MIDTWQRSSDIKRRDARTVVRFADLGFRCAANFRVQTGQLSESVASAWWNLVQLLEYLAICDGLEVIKFIVAA